jgi:phosphoglycerate dehydrogenase-like enzyme
MKRLAIIDDYEKLALSMGNWESLSPGVQTDAFNDHLVGEEALVKRLLPYDIVMIMRERTPFLRNIIEKLPNLKLLITSGPRNHSVDLAACSESGIVVCGTGSRKSPPTEQTWALMLALLKKIIHADSRMRKGIWGGDATVELADKTLGVLGLGRLGEAVSRVAQAFGMKVIAWSQNLTAERAAELGATRVEKDELFKTADIVTIHLVLSDRTRRIVGAREIGLMKPTAFIINTSRGPIIEEAALVDALKNLRIAGAGIDVYDVEPLPPDHPLLKLDNTVLSPHLGYVTQENFKTYYTQAVENVAAWLDGQPIRVLESYK